MLRFLTWEELTFLFPTQQFPNAAFHIAKILAHFGPVLFGTSCVSSNTKNTVFNKEEISTIVANLVLDCLKSQSKTILFFEEDKQHIDVDAVKSFLEEENNNPFNINIVIL